MTRIAPLLAAAILLTACDRDAWVPESSFSESVKEAYSECSEAEVRFLAAKHGIQTAFENCGSNNFVHFAWSPDGIRIYFQLPLAGHVMNAEDKTIGSLPVEQPVGNAVWLASDLLALPLGPAEGGESARMVLYNLAQASLETLELGFARPALVQAVGKRDQVLLASLEGDGRTRFHRVDFTTRQVTPALTWWTGTAESFTYSPEHDAVLIGQDDSVTWYTGETGEVVRTFPRASRGVLHPDGRYVALETLGDPISPFDQRAWGELSPEAQEREQRRSQEWLERQPDWVPKTVQPPELHVVDLETEARWRFTGFYGDRFQWYTASPDPMRHASFVMWGIEGKELNKNVALTDLSERLRYAASGNLPLGLEAWTSGEAQTVSIETPSADTE